ncbi:alpha-2-macroglobulin family protein [Pedobacter sp. SYSU D00535]|uniref:alpha-2-macroglobulin family protein n=1 Tax=Pedobacter sp. SYSU D00535 TaxID=2810308 RepID=UPI001A95DBB7|nr:alpha-2-macroglobulin family protein [Pedobacter sp. SYSU D00535]
MNKILITLLFSLCFSLSGFGQSPDKYEQITAKIDSLALAGLPKSALAQIEAFDKLARAEKNVPQQIKATIYKMHFLSYLEEQALETIIRQLRADIATSSYPVRPVLQSLLAEVFWRYYQQNRYQFNSRSVLEKPDPDFTRWDLKTIIKEVSSLYKASLINADQLRVTPLSVLQGVLAGDSRTRYLRPTLYDLLAHRALDFFLEEEPDLLRPRQPFSLSSADFFAPAEVFVNLKVQTADTSSTSYQGIQLLQDLTRFQLRENKPDALVDVDLKRLNFLFQKSVNPLKDSLYLQSLENIGGSFPESKIAAEALIHIGQYYQQKDSLKLARQYFEKARSYKGSDAAHNAGQRIKEIQQKEMSFSVENINIPNRPMLVLLRARNLSRMQYQLYKLSDKQVNEISKLNADAGRWGNESIVPSKALLRYLRQQKVFRTAEAQLPLWDDYRRYSTELALDPLVPGRYLFLGREAGALDDSLSHMLEFKVSNLAYSSRVNPSGTIELRTLNRETGEPLPKVNVIMKYVQYHSGKRADVTLGEGRSDENGLIHFSSVNKNNNQVTVHLKTADDELYDDSEYLYGVRSRADKEVEREHTFFFTDRQLYRPGQTVYFKGLQVVQSEAGSRIVSEEAMEVMLKDANDKELAKLQVKTNDFGTFQGSFIIPQNILNGRMSLRTEDGILWFRVEEYKRPTFAVELEPVKESYRLNDSITVKGRVKAYSGYGLSQARVAYRIVRKSSAFQDFRNGFFNRTTEILSDTMIANLAGEFNIRFKAVPDERSNQKDLVYTYELKTDATDLSGETRSNLQQITIGEKVHIINVLLPTLLVAGDGSIAGGTAAGTGTRGAPLYVVDGTPVEDINDLSPDDISNLKVLKGVEAAALYGSRAANGVVIITTKGKSTPSLETRKTNVFIVPVKLENLNRQDLEGVLHMKVYALKSPDRPLIDRLWPFPDRPLLSKKEYQQQFPFLPYKDEQDEKKWPVDRLIAEREIKLSPGKSSFLDLSFLKKQKTGSYRLEIAARDAKGDTSSIVLHTSLVAEPAAPVKLQNWVTPVKTSVVTGRAAEFMVGLGAPARILMETYDGDKRLSSRWISIGRKQQLIQIPVELTTKQPAVQFLTVFQNRMFSSYHRISILEPEKNLNIRFQTFRNKLEPGQKEQWSLQLSGQDRQVAEMVATLYDASLDNIVSPHPWQVKPSGIDSFAPLYFQWPSWNFVQAVNSAPFNYYYNNIQIRTRAYEALDLLGYSYFGGYNPGYHDYLRRLEEKSRILAADQRLKEEYRKNAALVKDGFDAVGRVTDKQGRPLVGVSVRLKGKSIGTSTDSKGAFRIKVPKHAVLIFAYIGFKSLEMPATSQPMTVQLKEDGAALEEVVITGYGTQKRKEVLGSVSVATVPEALQSVVPGAARELRIRGTSTVVAEDNAVYDFAGPVPLVKPKEISLRRNFQETAFFYPQLRTNEKGEIRIEFTIPETLTRWHFKGFAHTKGLQTGIIESEVITQKSLMISANTPRFLREGDTILLSARIANLTEAPLSGQVRLQLFNALNMQQVMLLADPAQAEQAFQLESGQNKAVSFRLIVPSSLDAITYRLTADGGDFTDGEENTIPVLPNSMLVMESMPMLVRAGQNKNFSFEKLLNNRSTTLRHKTLTLEYTQNPVWYAVQALPYLMEFPYECSEQTFSRYFANSLASSIVTRLPKIKTVFEQWKGLNSYSLWSNLEKNQELKALLIEETPWLREAMDESEQKKRLALLFDLNKMRDEMQLNLEKLQKMQRPDGGFPWFAGGNYSDRYITQHILGGMGQLQRVKAVNLEGRLLDVTENALKFVEQELIEDYREALKYEQKHRTQLKEVSTLTLHAMYVRSYFPGRQQSAALKSALNYFLPKLTSSWKLSSVYEQGLAAFVLHRHNFPLPAKSIIASLKETAQQSEELGMYWAKNRLGYYWYQSPIETQALLIELFSEVATDAKALEEMKIWLLRNKQTSNWRTTKATAMACFALLLRGGNWVESEATARIQLGGKSLNAIKPELKSEPGTGYLKTVWTEGQISKGMGDVQIQNTGKVLNWGALHWQYLEQLDKISSAETELKLERKYFIRRQTDAGPELIAVDGTNIPKNGDVLKVVVYLNADRDYEYVHLKDMRPSGTEPVDVLSGYKYQERFYYYQVTKDVATNFFINYLPKGSYVFEYELRVVQPGNYSTGISSIQCLYAPEFNAHSAGRRMEIR